MLAGQRRAARGARARAQRGAARGGAGERGRPPAGEDPQGAAPAGGRGGAALRTGVTGGAEAHAAQVAQRLAPHWDITGADQLCDRPPHLGQRAARRGSDGGRRAGAALQKSATAPDAGASTRLSRRLFGRSQDRAEEEHWMADRARCSRACGVTSPSAAGDYDGVVSFTYLYVPTAWSVPLVGRRTLLVPTAHEDEALAFDVLRRGVRAATRAAVQHARGAGAHPPPIPAARPGPRGRRGGGRRRQSAPSASRTRYDMPGPYLLYLGRVERGKGHPGAARGARATPERDGGRAGADPGRRGEHATSGRKECGCWVESARS